MDAHVQIAQPSIKAFAMIVGKAKQGINFFDVFRTWLHIEMVPYTEASVYSPSGSIYVNPEASRLTRQLG